MECDWCSKDKSPLFFVGKFALYSECKKVYDRNKKRRLIH